MVALPVIVPGWAGTCVTDTDNVRALLLPQLLIAVTEIVPLVPAVAVIEFVVDVPDHPDGIIQL